MNMSLLKTNEHRLTRLKVHPLIPHLLTRTCQIPSDVSQEWKTHVALQEDSGTWSQNIIISTSTSQADLVVVYSLHLVEIVCASVVNIMQESSSYHGHHLQICVIALQFSCLAPVKHI